MDGGWKSVGAGNFLKPKKQGDCNKNCCWKISLVINSYECVLQVIVSYNQYEIHNFSSSLILNSILDSKLISRGDLEYGYHGWVCFKKLIRMSWVVHLLRTQE